MNQITNIHEDKRDDPLGKYIIVTPVKNEEENLPKLIESITNQTITPSLWVIVNDGSKDNTSDMIKEGKEKYEWIKSIYLRGGDRELGFHYASIVKKGFDYALSHIMKNGINYEYIGIIDADMIQLERDFFEKLIKEFEKNPKLGIGSGNAYYFKKGKILREKTKKSWPLGPQMLWRRKCFEECGYIIAKSADAASVAKARMKGWETRGYKHLKIVVARKVGGIFGEWKTGKYEGESMYSLNYNILIVIGKSIIHVIKGNPKGLSMILGYFSSFLFREKQIDDRDVKKYFWSILLKELIQEFRRKLGKR